MPTPFQMLAQCTRLDIALKKNTTTFKCAHDLPVALFYPMVFPNKIFSNRKYFFQIYKLQNTPFFLEVCKFEEKIILVGNLFFANTVTGRSCGNLKVVFFF